MALADVNADLELYARYSLTGSVADAQAYIVAARKWLHLSADSASNQSSSMTIGKQHVADEMKAAKAFVQANSDANSVGRTRFLHVGSQFR